MPNHFAVFGNPILHSRSPQIFRSVFSTQNLNAGYTRIHPQSAEKLVSFIKLLGLRGANVTAPFKMAVMPLLEELSPQAKAIGAVNTIVNTNGYLVGHNTDWMGVIGSLKHEGIPLKNAKCLIVGAGGAARAAAYGLAQEGVTLFITNRTFQKAEQIAADFGATAIPFNQLSTHQRFDIIISTLPPIDQISFLDKLHCQVLFDVNYHTSKITDWALSKGIRTIGGEQWLIHQAKGSFTHFFGYDVVVQHFALGLKQTLPKGKPLKYLIVDSKTRYSHIDFTDIELIIDGEGLTVEQQTAIWNEEYSKALQG